MPVALGTVVVDRRCGQRAVVRAVTRVPRGRDLFGRPLPAHRRYILAYDDGRWSDSRYDDDIEPVAADAGTARAR